MYTPQVRNEFYKDTQGAIMVYDVGSRSSFEALDSWLGEMKREMGDASEMGPRCILCLRKQGTLGLIDTTNFVMIYLDFQC